MKKRIIYLLFPFILLGIMFFQGGCVKENFDTVPLIKDTSDLVVSLSIAELKKVNGTAVKPVKEYLNADLWQKIKERNKANGLKDTTSAVIEGYVISSDSTGNFYEVFTIQDTSGGIDIKVNTSDLYSMYRLKPGQKVKVKINNLFLGKYNGIHQLGSAILNQGAYKMVGLPAGEVTKYVERTGFRKHLIPDTLFISELDTTYFQKLVCIKDVQFSEPTSGFSIPGINTSRNLIDCSGNTLILRTSGYATFCTTPVPTLNGTITGVIVPYNKTNQLVIRDLNDINFNNPRCGSSTPTPNKSIVDLKAMYTGGSYVKINDNVVISGVIIANDEAGNIYNQLFIQDESGAIEFKVYLGGLAAEYPVGAKVNINCNGMYLGLEEGVVKLGGLFGENFGKLDGSLFYPRVFVSSINNPVVPINTSLSQLNDSDLNKLVSLDDVQFIESDLNKAWSEPTASANRKLTDIFSNSLVVYTSFKARFAGYTLPSGRGRFTAILSKYSGKYELLVRDLRDINLNKPRFNFKLTQDFNSASPAFPITVGGWQSIAQTGTRNWLGQSSSMSGATHYYAEMNADGSGSNNTAWLISPQVNLAGMVSKTLFFQTAYNTWTGNGALEVLISTNFNGTDVTSANWTPVSGARIVLQTDVANTWVGSGNIDINQYTGNIHLAFKYTSAGGAAATAFRVDNVKIY